MLQPEVALHSKAAHTNALPRLVIYYQTHHDSSGKFISIRPLLQPGISVTHVILAAIHINEDPNSITLNDQVLEHPRYQPLWPELRILQASGVKVMGMLGGAAKGSFLRLDGSNEQFERYYAPLRDLVHQRKLDGLDLDVEEEMSLQGMIRLIDRLRSDFGKDFIITLAPVAKAMLDPTKNLSGFDYMELEVVRGNEIAWYNTQFYCGWGDLSNTLMYELMVQKGWNPEKIVVGMVTNPKNANGFVPLEMLLPVLGTLKRQNQRFGGIMGWEYFNSLPGDIHQPWEWARMMTIHLGRGDAPQQ
ncbi:hypothetical protein GGI25_002314 [Coemansia spiralis]|uniref:chitinase n=2 Tax=Coemansia TaxID=4863 RepID=A0A9W8KYN6_9FUNG|nr:glycoside hydrolase superfamily [Coemansia spiralis]KAJ1989581.1 hypothetical protein EDC05_004615 [Coemansia umbellata]KAJ2625702.1 hypothetical protein GGI26_000502 [Coemansia sp. RSA 1358]KAJ2678520.1 hypothetical protein GGI25_002314 [Coemansia spiralis]